MPGPLPNQWGAEPCLDLVNTRWSDHLGSGVFHDRLPLPVWRRAFLKHWGFRVADPDDARGRRRMQLLRPLLREALELHAAGRPLSPRVRVALEREINRAGFVVRIDARTGVLVLRRSGDDWTVVASEITTSALRLIAERRRVKVCANPNCSWMFVDESRSGSRRWCDVSICGSLINVRRHRGPAKRRTASQ